MRIISKAVTLGALFCLGCTAGVDSVPESVQAMSLVLGKAAQSASLTNTVKPSIGGNCDGQLPLGPRCEGAVCLESIPGGVAEDAVTLHGHLQKSASTLLVHFQHEATKAYGVITKIKIDAKNQFAIRVPLTQLGPTTISLQASRPGEPPSIFTLRVTRVLAPKLVDIQVLEAGMGKVEVRYTPKFSCPSCDFLGTQTGGTQLSVENGHFTRSSNITVGGSYCVSLPVQEGENQMRASVCNAAGCVKMELPTKTYQVNRPSVRWIQPAITNNMIINASPLSLQFAIDHWTPVAGKACAGEVKLEWNRADAVSICPSNGEYRAEVMPVVGVNELGVQLSSGEVFRYTIGAGKISSGPLGGAIWVGLGQKTLEKTLPAVVNNLLQSDSLGQFIKQAMTSPGSDAALSETAKSSMNAIRDEIPHCKRGNGAPIGLEVVGMPKVASARLSEVTVGDQEMRLALEMEGVEVHLKTYADKNQDGQPDKSFIPLKIGFSQLRIPLILKHNSQLLLTSDMDDCKYKSLLYCKHRPSPVQPTLFKGSASKGGAFVACDTSQVMPEGRDESDCVDMNIVNMQTGQLSETMLDSVNDALYCDVSARLTYWIREGEIKLPIKKTVAGMSIDESVQLQPRQFVWDNRGIYLGMSSVIAEGTAPVLVSDKVAQVSGDLAGHMMGAGINVGFVNQVLARAVYSGKLLDWDLDEAVLTEMGVDYSKCETKEVKDPKEAKEPPAYCKLRFLVKDMLGSDLTAAHYYDPGQKLRLRIRGNRDLAPYVRIRQQGERHILDIDIPGLELGVEAIVEKGSEPIVTAQVTLLLSAEVGALKGDPAKPEEMILPLTILTNETRVRLSAKPGSNHTTLPDAVMFNQLESMVRLGMQILEQSNQFVLPIPKTWAVPAGNSLLDLLGVTDILLGEGHMAVSLDTYSDAFTLTLDPILVQHLSRAGLPQTFTLTP